MRTPPLPRTHRRTRSRRARRHTRTLRTLEDRLATLGHDRTRRRDRCRTHRCCVNRTRSRLWNDETPLRSRRSCACCRLSRLTRTRVRRSRSRRSPFAMCWRGETRRRCWSWRRNRSCRFGRSIDCRRFWRCNHGLRLHRDRIVFDRNRRLGRLGRLSSRLGRSHWRLRRNDHRCRRTRDGLRRNEARRRLRRLGGSRGLRAGSYGSGRLRRRNDRASRRRRRRYGTRRGSRLSRALRDRLQHIARLGDVRQVDLGLELVRPRRRRTRATGRASAGMLRIVVLHALGFIHFDRTRVRFLFCDTDIGKYVEDFFALHLEFPRQIIDSNLVLHYAPSPRCCPAGYAFIASSRLWLMFGRGAA